MELKEIKELIELVSEKGFTEFELQKHDFKLKIVTSLNQEVVITPKLPVEITKKEKVIISEEKALPLPIPQKESKPEQELYKVKSPIVGTFYRAPSPTADPYVKIGSQIKKGSILCIIEAMKLMNEIESDVIGEVVEIYVENNHPVEYGQPLFGVKISQ